MRAELTFTELDLQQVELLPAREALGVFNWAAVRATNTAIALNVASVNSAAWAAAGQAVIITQQ